MTIRPARPDDDAWLRRLLFASLQEEYGPQDPGDLNDEWHTRMCQRGRQIWIAEIDGEPAGFVWMLHLPDPLFAAGDYYLYYLAVAPAHRQQGLATALMRQARAVVPGTLRLLVRTGSPAKALYQRLGAHLAREEWHWPEPKLGDS